MQGAIDCVVYDDTKENIKHESTAGAAVIVLRSAALQRMREFSHVYGQDAAGDSVCCMCAQW